MMLASTKNDSSGFSAAGADHFEVIVRGRETLAY
jgi:hypothetical protein